MLHHYHTKQQQHITHIFLNRPTSFAPSLLPLKNLILWKKKNVNGRYIEVRAYRTKAYEKEQGVSSIHYYSVLPRVIDF